MSGARPRLIGRTATVGHVPSMGAGTASVRHDGFCEILGFGNVPYRTPRVYPRADGVGSHPVAPECRAARRVRLTHRRARVPFAPVSPPAHRKVKLTVEYDGAGFFGWQTQPGVRTVQGELEKALSRLANEPVIVIGAGRTDRGVHATGQVAGASVPERWTPSSLRRSLNAILPEDMWIAAAVEAPAGFHARYDAVARSYLYRVGTTDAARSPFRHRWCWPLAEPIDPAALNEAAAPIVGDHSFAAFAKSGQPERGTRCVVHEARWTPWGGIGVQFHVTANRFLHHMVRYLVGTMVDVARGRRPAADMAALLAGEPGLETSPPAPPQGLFLTRVLYPDDASHIEGAIASEGITDEDLP